MPKTSLQEIEQQPYKIAYGKGCCNVTMSRTSLQEIEQQPSEIAYGKGCCNVTMSRTSLQEIKKESAVVLPIPFGEGILVMGCSQKTI